MDYTYGAAGGPAAWDIYNTDGANFGNQWRFEIYGGAIVTFKDLIKAADEVGSTSYRGIAKIMRAYTFAIATDTWGDVPYSEAGLGEEFLQARLDSQEDIYKGNAGAGIQSLFDMMTEIGIADLNTASTVNPGSDDVVYGGNLDNWKRAGYTLMLKLAMQMSDREPALAASIINEVATANQYISANTQNLSVKFGGSTGSQSPIHTWTNVSLFLSDMNVSTGYVNLLSGKNDPRLDTVVTRPNGVFTTYENGFIGTLVATDKRSRWNTAITGVGGVGPVRLLTNAQRAFIMAEAAIAIPGVNFPKTAQEYYEEGIRSSMLEFGVPVATIDTYFNDNDAEVTLSGTTEEQIAQIITQKYIAGTGNGLEAWNDYRRTGYPAFDEHLNAVGIDGKRPRRAQYINEEVQRNPNFANVVLPNVNVWWDVD